MGMGKKPSVSNFEIVAQGPVCDERCPVGICHKFDGGEEEQGQCRWFFGSVTENGNTYTPSSYHCKVKNCDQAKGHGDCVTQNGESYYRITKRDAPCQKERSADEEQAEKDKIAKE